MLNDTRIKRLTYRSWHRGSKEADLMLGRFAAKHLGALSEPLLALYEALLEENDPDIWEWATGMQPTPPRYQPLPWDKIRESAKGE